MDDERMIVVALGECSNPVRTEEFVLVEHARQNAAQPVLVDQRSHTALAIPEMTGPGWMYAVKQFGHTLVAFMQDLSHPRYPVALPRLDDGGRAQGQQAHHGADLEPPGTAIGEPQNVIVESVFLVPHPFRSGLIHGACDPNEMLRKL